MCCPRRECFFYQVAEFQCNWLPLQSPVFYFINLESIIQNKDPWRHQTARRFHGSKRLPYFSSRGSHPLEPTGAFCKWGPIISRPFRDAPLCWRHLCRKTLPAHWACALPTAFTSGTHFPPSNLRCPFTLLKRRILRSSSAGKLEFYTQREDRATPAQSLGSSEHSSQTPRIQTALCRRAPSLHGSGKCWPRTLLSFKPELKVVHHMQ